MKKKNIKLNVIIQAGGKGTRLKHNTWNRPKWMGYQYCHTMGNLCDWADDQYLL